MKTLLIILFAVIAVIGQDVDETMTESLQRAQAELTIGHEFFERTIVNSREQLSAQVYSDSRVLTESHLDAYADIKTIVLDTTALMDDLPVTPDSEECLAASRNRWDIQILRYGRRLSDCIDVAHRRFDDWNNQMNGLHATIQHEGNQVQNQGLDILAEATVFDGRDSFYSLINRRFRIMLGIMLSHQDGFRELREEFERGSEEEVARLMQCDRRIVEDFYYEAQEDYRRARLCVPREE